MHLYNVLPFRGRVLEERHMQKICSIVIAVLLFAACPLSLDARPKKGFHSGPYLTFEAGVIQADFDRDEATGLKNGDDFEPSFGFLFGWNVYDWLSAEIQGRYATNINSGRREHIGGGAVFAKYTFIADSLTDFEGLRILPFAKFGVSALIGAFPGTAGASDGIAAHYGIGASPGAGIAFQWKKYLYFGVDLQEDLLTWNESEQTVNGVPGVVVYKGGFKPNFSAMAILGVHY